jgi:LysR family glycine cleavage system transcriptional activator
VRKLPPLNAIRVFEAAARNASFTLAARELSITVTAVSHQIRQLEEMLQAKLFERNSKGITLSDVGERLFPSVRDGLDLFANAFSELHDKNTTDVVNITTTRSFAERWLLPRLPQFRSAQSSIAINVDASDGIADLHSGEMDLAIRYGRRSNEHLPTVELLDDKYFAVCHSSLWNCREPPTIHDLVAKPLLGYRWMNQSLEGPDWQLWFDIAGTSKSEFQTSWFSEEGLAIQAMEHGYGPLLCSDVLLHDLLKSAQCVRIAGPTLPGLSYRLIQAPAGSRKKGVRVFLQWLLAEVNAFKIQLLECKF